MPKWCGEVSVFIHFILKKDILFQAPVILELKFVSSHLTLWVLLSTFSEACFSVKHFALAIHILERSILVEAASYIVYVYTDIVVAQKWGMFVKIARCSFCDSRFQFTCGLVLLYYSVRSSGANTGAL